MNAEPAAAVGDRAATGDILGDLIFGAFAKAIRERVSAGCGPYAALGVADAVARHHHFEIAPCNVGAGHENGRVEAGVGYVKKNFLAGLDIPDFLPARARRRRRSRREEDGFQ